MQTFHCKLKRSKPIEASFQTFRTFVPIIFFCSNEKHFMQMFQWLLFFQESLLGMLILKDRQVRLDHMLFLILRIGKSLVLKFLSNDRR